jgi:hypothetical protein
LAPAILVSLYFTLFFTYGHVYHYLEANHIFGISLGRHRLLAVIWLFIAIAGSWIIVRKTKDTKQVTQALNIIGMVLISMPMISMLIYTIRINILDKTNQIAGRKGRYRFSSPA